MMIKINKNRKGFTLIELLVVIAIIAILAVVVVLTLNPAELLKQARDSNRASDFATLKSALGLYGADVSTTTWLNGAGATLGTTTVFLSQTTTVTLAGATGFSTTTCSGGTGSTGGWGFIGNETVASSGLAIAANARSINGNGWIPVNFNAISSGAPIGSLPVDPAQSSGASPLVYAYAAAQSTYKLSAKMESVKYSQGGSNDTESTDGGQSNCTFEQGTAIGTQANGGL